MRDGLPTARAGRISLHMAKPRLKKLRTRLVRDADGRQTGQQYGALCYRITRKGKLRILLVTSRRTKRWVSPKGWPMRAKTPAEAAAQEAWEEAGVQGRIWSHSIGFYSYRKYLGKGRSLTCNVQVFPLEVDGQTIRFPETRERIARWMKPKKAARKVAEPGLAKLIRAFPEALREEGLSPRRPA